MKANVKFLPPSPHRGANRRRKIAGLVGVGAIDVSPAGARFIGKRGQIAVPLLIGIAAGMAGGIVAVAVAHALQLDAMEGRVAIKMALFTATVVTVLPGVFAYHLSRQILPGPLIDALVPWGAIRMRLSTPHLIELTSSSSELSGDISFGATDTDSATLLADALDRWVED